MATKQASRRIAVVVVVVLVVRILVLVVVAVRSSHIRTQYREYTTITAQNESVTHKNSLRSPACRTSQPHQAALQRAKKIKHTMEEQLGIHETVLESRLNHFRKNTVHQDSVSDWWKMKKEEKYSLVSPVLFKITQFCSFSKSTSATSFWNVQQHSSCATLVFVDMQGCVYILYIRRHDREGIQNRLIKKARYPKQTKQMESKRRNGCPVRQCISVQPKTAIPNKSSRLAVRAFLHAAGRCNRTTMPSTVLKTVALPVFPLTILRTVNRHFAGPTPQHRWFGVTKMTTLLVRLVRHLL